MEGRPPQPMAAHAHAPNAMDKVKVTMLADKAPSCLPRVERDIGGEKVTGIFAVLPVWRRVEIKESKRSCTFRAFETL